MEGSWFLHAVNLVDMRRTKNLISLPNVSLAGKESRMHENFSFCLAILLHYYLQNWGTVSHW
jgi:hypothetical protein